MIRFGPPRHVRFMIPIYKYARFTVAINRQIRMKPRALSLGMLIRAYYLLGKVPQKL